MRKGVAVSPGVAVGVAYCIHQIYVSPDTRQLAPDEVRDELARFERGRAAAAADLKSLYTKVSSQVGPAAAQIFQVHDTILHDPALVEKIRYWIAEKRQSVAYALDQVLNEYVILFERTADEYLRERLADVRDVIVRISAHLSEVLHPTDDIGNEPLVLVADELLPSQVVTLGNRKMAAIVTESGGKTSHAAILARAQGIPAVSGVAGLLKQVQNGDRIVVDGREGLVIVNPDAETESAYRKLQREYFDLKDHLAENRDLPANTCCGEPLELLANINNLGDAEAAQAMGAAGVGLYRTEYLFLTHPNVPDEEEQLANYRKIIFAAPKRRITIRSLDLGGDKAIAYMGDRRDPNPFMGWRSIRLSFEHPEFFSTQIRAVLRAAAGQKRVSLMFPMITTLEEIRRVRGIVARAVKNLRERGKAFGEVSLGMMLEVPAAAVCIESMLKEVDFVSIGSNDLVQYLMAADRDNPRVSHLCQPLSPAVLRVLTDVIQACRRAGKPVTLCGEMAGAPRAYVLLLGMGLRSFSMSPALIPAIKDLAAHVTVGQAEQILAATLKLRTTAQIQRYLGKQVAKLAPNLKLLDSE